MSPAEKVCGRKERFGSWGRARKVAKAMNRRHRGQDRFVEVYQCRVCGGVHVGSRPKAVR